MTAKKLDQVPEADQVPDGAEALGVRYRFTGEHESYVTLPDASVRLTQPGELVALPDYGEAGPGPAWVIE